jgi:hypothetical protein
MAILNALPLNYYWYLNVLLYHFQDPVKETAAC